MTLSLAQDAIALLIDLAERGEIDPWDVKVIDVIDRFLSELAPTQATSRELYESNLSHSGQAFLYASMLVLLKADSMAQAETAAEAPEEEVEFLEAPESAPGLPMYLERQLRRRAVAQPPRQRRVTLKELIDQLQVISAALEDRAPRGKARRPRPQSRSQAVRAIAQLAHQENLSELALELEEFFKTYWAEITSGKTWLDFDLLIELWTYLKQHSVNSVPPDRWQEQVALAETQPSTHDRVGVFWALLLLSAQSKVELAQEEFYQDLRIYTLSALKPSEISEFSALTD